MSITALIIPSVGMAAYLSPSDLHVTDKSGSAERRDVVFPPRRSSVSFLKLINEAGQMDPRCPRPACVISPPSRRRHLGHARISSEFTGGGRRVFPVIKYRRFL